MQRKLHRTPRPARRRGRSQLAWVLGLPALVIVAGAVWLLVSHFSHAKPAPKPIAAPVVVRVLVPEGETRRQIAVRAHVAGLSGSYLAASERSTLLDPAHYGAPAGTPDLEGFLFPATYELYAGAPAGQLVSEQLQAFTERFGPHELAARPGAARDAVRTADRRLDGRARGQAARRPAEDRGRHLQPAARRHAAGDRRHHLLRGRGAPTHTDLRRRTDRSAAAHRFPLQHPPAHRLAADPDLQPGDGLDRSGRAPGARPLPVLRRGRRRLRRAGVLHDARPNSKPTSRPTRPPSRTTAANRPSASTSDATPGRPRLARRAQPLAGDAQRRAGRCWAWRTGAISCCRFRPSGSPRRFARSRPPGSWGRT